MSIVEIEAQEIGKALSLGFTITIVYALILLSIPIITIFFLKYFKIIIYKCEGCGEKHYKILRKNKSSCYSVNDDKFCANCNRYSFKQIVN